MDYNELKNDRDKLKLQIEKFHIFYEDFSKYDTAISNGSGLLVEMLSDLVKVKKKGNNSDKVIEQEKRLVKLLDIMELMQGLNNKCQSQKLVIKHQSQDNSIITHKVERLDQELEAIKKAFKDN